ncbi:MAG: hypothetical protein ACMUJM_11520 [bacterium]
MQIDKVEIIVKGRPIMISSMRIDNKIIIITGKLIKTAKIKEEWFENIEDPDLLIRALKNAKAKPDFFTFWQRPPEIKPKFSFYMEWEAISAIPIKNFDNWWEKQISSANRNKIRKSAKKGVVVKPVDFNDELVKGIRDIFNETPIKRGKPFWHYGKDFETVKREWSKDLERSDFIGAYYNDQLIGFVKLVYAGKLALQVENISKIEHRNKYTNNALISKAVEICAKKEIPYLTFGAWRRGSHADFLTRNGFEKILLPRYYIPLTIKGKIILNLKLHHGVIGILPKKLLVRLIDLRSKWYAIKYCKMQQHIN